MKRPNIKQTSFFLPLLIVIFSIFSTGCQEITGPDQILNPNPGPQFDMDLFEANLISAFDGNATGYAYSIGLNGQAAREGAGGQAIVAGTSRQYPNAVDMTPYRRMHIASISKPITAMALFKAIEQNEPGMQLDEPFAQFMPAHWDVHPSLSQITLMHLLEHRSGILTTGETLTSLRQIVEAGVQPADTGIRVYNNVNFSLFRIIIPHILHGPTFGIASEFFVDNVIDEVTQNSFREFVTEEILEPANINHDAWNPHPTTPVLHYDCSDMSKPGWLTGNLEHRAGAYGLYLSPNGVASVYAHARYANGFLTEEHRDWLFEEGVSWTNTTGEHGAYPNHTGGWRSTDDRGYRGVVMVFPNNVEATVMINCRQDNVPGGPLVALRTAYDNAWVTP